MSSSNVKSLTSVSSVVPSIMFQHIRKQNILICTANHLVFILKLLKSHITFQYSLLSSISGVDLIGYTYRFCLSYDLLSLVFNNRLRIKVFLNEFSSICSLCSLFINANWWEREIWDLYGIYFENHLDLRRILTDYGFEGHPLKKDFPLSGYVEVRYNEDKKRVITESLELTQEFRYFLFRSPW